jgi:carboxymethylenebutenolidase
VTETIIPTDDGRCPAYEFVPEGAGPWPGVLVFMDAIGIRPAMFEIGERLSRAGYVVLLPDLFYRSGPYEPMNAKTVFADPDERAVLMERFLAKVTTAKVMGDTRAFLDRLASRADVAPKRFGTTGYCMGGRLSLCAAGHFPDRIAAAASYHGGNLASDAPDSPHLLAPKMKARLYVAGATEDRNFPDEQKTRLEKALTDARVDHVIETYPARHGWVPSDTSAHDPAAAERHWTTLVALLDRTLKV